MAGHNNRGLNDSFQLVRALLEVDSTTHRVDIKGKRIGDESRGVFELNLSPDSV